MTADNMEKKTTITNNRDHGGMSAIRFEAAFVLYRPAASGIKAKVNICRKAETILSYAVDPSGEIPASLESVTALCSRWASLLSKAGNSNRRAKSDAPGLLIEVISSHRRGYCVQGIVLDGRIGGSVSRLPTYLFILERPNPTKFNFKRIFREKHLSPREQDLIPLLFSEMTNKEIGQVLGLSTNTVKGYLKTLALRLGVSTRPGIMVSLCMPENVNVGKTADKNKR
jgi:DNA-binding CsgD family transcriptional regulator